MLKKARIGTVILGIGALTMCVLGLRSPDGSTALKIYAALAVLMMIGAAALFVKFNKCPWCGAPLYNGYFYLKDCPRCKRNLNSGEMPDDNGGAKQ